MAVVSPVISKPDSLLEDQPDSIILSFEHELDDLIGLMATPEYNLNARNYEWVVVTAFETLRENVDQDYLQAEFVINVISTLMPHIRLIGEGKLAEFDFVSQILLTAINRLHHRLIYEKLFHRDRFPYVPVRFASLRDIIFERKSDGLPFILKDKI